MVKQPCAVQAIDQHHAFDEFLVATSGLEDNMNVQNNKWLYKVIAEMPTESAIYQAIAVLQIPSNPNPETELATPDIQLCAHHIDSR